MANQVAVDVEVAWPYIQKRLEKYLVGATVGGGSGSSSGIVGEHDLAGPLHTGTLLRSQAPWVSADIASAIASHAALVDVHHARQHDILASADHVITGGAALDVIGQSAPGTLARLTPSSAPGASEKILKSSSVGNLTLPTVVATTSITTPTITTGTNVDLLIDPGGTGAVLFPNAQTVRSSTFSGWTVPYTQGYQINEYAPAPGQSANVLTISRIQADELDVRVFVANETRVDRGDEFWTKSFGIVAENFSTPSSIGGTVSVKFENSPAIAGAIFANNDWVMIRKLEISSGLSLFTIWGQVATYVNNGDGTQSWTFTLRAGATNKLIDKGSLAIDFGAAGAALIHLSVVDASGSPYIKLRKWTGSDPMSAPNFTTYLQIGHLGSTGNPNVTPAGFGLYARSTSDASRFILADDNGLQIRNASLAVWNGSNNDILIDQDGIRVRAVATEPLDDINAYRFETATGTVMGGLYARHFGIHEITLRAMGDNTNDPYLNIKAVGTTANGDANVYLYAVNNEVTATKEASIWLDVDDTVALVRLAADDYIRFEAATQSFYDHSPYLDLGANLGSAGKRWGVLYANQIIAGTISGTSMSGATWQYPGNMVIDATSASDTTVNVTNSGSGAVIFDVLGTLRQNGTAVSLSGHTHDDRYFTETESDARYVQTATLGSYVLKTGDTMTGALVVNYSTTGANAATTVRNTAATSGNAALLIQHASTLTSRYLLRAQNNYSVTPTDIFTLEASGRTTLIGTLGIGITPTQALHVSGSGWLTDSLAIGTSAPSGIRSININKAYNNDSVVHGTYFASIDIDGAITTTRATYGFYNELNNYRDATDIGANSHQVYGGNSYVYNHDGSVASIAMAGNNFLYNNAGTITTGYGSQFSLINDTTGTVTTAYGVAAVVRNDAGSMPTAYGVYAWVNQAVAAGVITDSYAVYARQDRDAGTSTNAYLYYGTFEGTHTLKRGLWLSGETENALSGKLAVGSLTSPTYTLDVTGNGRVTLDLVVGGAAGITGAVTLGSSLAGTSWNITTGGAATLVTAAASTSVTTPTVTTASGNLALTSVGGTVAVTGALTGTSTATFTTSVVAPLHTATSGNLTVSAPATLYLNAATANTVDLQVNSVSQWSASSSRLNPRGSVLVDIGDYNRKVRTLFAAELYVETLVAQNVLATIGGRVMVAPTTKLIADLSTSAPIPLWTNLTSWWTLDEASGNRSDSKGSNTLTDTNTVMSVGGKKSAAGMFVKANSERLTIADNASLSVGDIDFYIAAWVYPTLDDGASQHTIAAKAAGSGNRAWYLYIDWAANQAKFRVFDATDASTTVTASTFGNLSINTWYFIEAIHDSVNNQVTIAVNGTSTSASHTTGSRDDSGPFQLGAANGASLFDGYIDEALFAKYIPTSAERAWLYNGGTGRSYTELVAVHTIDVEHNQWTSGDYVYMQTAPGGIPQIEAMQVISSAVAITGGYRYWINRNLDGTGANSWVTGDAVVNLGGAAGEGYLELTATSTIHNHLGPTTTYYVRTGTVAWNDVKPVVTQGNLRSFLDYTGDEFGTAAGNDLTLTPTTGFQGYALDRVNGLRLFNVDFRLYESATKRMEIIPSAGLNLLADNTTTNTRQIINWYRDLDSKSATPAASLLCYTAGVTNNMNLFVFRDGANYGASMALGAPTSYIVLTEVNSTTSTGELYAGSWLVTGNVGFGTAATATMKLEINGHARIATGSSLYLGGQTDASGSGLRLYYNSGAFIDATDNDIVFRANDTTGATERMRINYSTGAVTFANSVGTDWTNLSYASGWGDYGGGFTPGQYKKVGDLVFLRGLVARTSGVSGTIATLPVGYRPQYRYLFGVHTDNGGGGDRVDILTSGNIDRQTGGVAYVQLDGLVFSTMS